MSNRTANLSVLIIAAIAVFVVIASSMVLFPDTESRYKGVTAPTAVEQPTDTVAEVEQAVEQVAEEPVAVIEETVEEMQQAVTEQVASVEETMQEVQQAVVEEVAVVEEKVEDMAQQLVSETTSESTVTSGLYSVVDGNKLDAFSYEGFKLFRNWCARCHGTYGQGMVGPNLANSLQVISKEQFVETVTNGKTGQIGSMPAWSSNDAVMAGIDNLYAYLMARADGAIGEVKPSKQK